MQHSGANSWFAIQVRARSEQLAASQLKLRGLEVLLPTYPRVRVWSDRAKKVRAPLIPGYVFCQFDSAMCLPVVSCPGVLRIVGVGNRPAPVDEQDILNLKRIDESILGREPYSMYRPGSKVTIRYGPLKGVTGSLLRADRNTRLIVTIELLQRAVAVELDEAWVMPVAPETLPFQEWQV